MSIAAYRGLENLPSRAIGELFDGQLRAQSRPAAPEAEVRVDARCLNPSFQQGITLEIEDLATVAFRDLHIPDFHINRVRKGTSKTTS